MKLIEKADRLAGYLREQVTARRDAINKDSRELQTMRFNLRGMLVSLKRYAREDPDNEALANVISKVEEVLNYKAAPDMSRHLK